METLKNSIDGGRLIAARNMRVYKEDENLEPLPDGAYLVQSGSNLYYTTTKPSMDCECGDFVWRNVICKHLIASLIAEDDHIVSQIIEENGLESMFIGGLRYGEGW